jgi:prolyl 4-hydroxylase
MRQALPLVSSARCAGKTVENDSALAVAAAQDAAGNHDAAIDTLAAATQRGDLDAMTELGKRLLVGDRAPALPAEATGLLRDACRLGNAEAAMRLAVLTALGCHVGRSLPDALGLLATAAERGSANARGQLAALCTDRALAQSVAGGGTQPGLWQRMAQAADIAAWSRAPTRSTLSASPLVCSFADFVTIPLCDWLITRARGRLKRARVYNTQRGADVEDAHRSNTIAEFSLADADLVQVALQMRMAAACGIPIENMEAPAILHYDVGEQINNHYDFINPQTPGYTDEIARRGERVVTFLVYLNDGYAGGETEFPKLGLKHKAARGEGLFFVNALPSGEPDLRTLHAGRPPASGEKWIVSQFIRNRRVLPGG